MSTEPQAVEDVYCPVHGVLCYLGEGGAKCPLCKTVDGGPEVEDSVPVLLPIAAFCEDRVDHHGLIEAAAEGGLRWGAGRLVRGENRLDVSFGSADSNVLVIEIVPGQPEYYIVAKENAYWTKDLQRVFRISENGSQERKQATARTRMPAKGLRIAVDSVEVLETGVVQLFEQSPPPAPTPAPAPSPASRSDPSASNEKIAEPKTTAGKFKGMFAFAGIAGIAILGLIGFLNFNSLENRLDRALGSNNLFGPDGALSIYKQARASSPQSEAMTRAGQKLRAKLEPLGTDVFDKWYRDSEPANWGQISEAYEVLSAVDSSNSEFAARKIYADAQVRFEERRFQEAYQLYDSALKFKPSWVLALNGKAKVLIRTDSPLFNGPLGIRAFQDAIAADPQFVWAYKNLGEFYKQESNWTEAVRYLSQAAQIAPNRPSITVSLSDAQRRAAQAAQRAQRRRR